MKHDVADCAYRDLRCTQIFQPPINSPNKSSGHKVCSSTASMREGLDEFEGRTKQFAIDAIKLCGRLEEVRGLRQLSWQLADSSGSVAANHRAMRRARSDREFAAKLQIVN